MRILSYEVPQERDGQSVRAICRGPLQLSWSLLNHIKLQEMGICLNGVRVRTNAIVHTGDIVTVRLDDPLVEKRAPGVQFPLKILFEDEDLLIISKPAGVPIHAREGRFDALENYLHGYLPEHLAAHPISRLDKGTTGLLAVAKNGHMHDLMQRQMHSPAFIRTYLAVCEGVPFPLENIIDRPIGRIGWHTVKREVRDDASPSKTLYKVLKVVNGRSLLYLIPYTGRTHQLRVHMASLGHPLTGDFMYGTEIPEISRPALHSAEIHFTHPLTGQVHHIVDPLPEDMQHLLLE